MLERIILQLIILGYERKDLVDLTILELSELLVTEEDKATQYEWKVTRLGKVYYAQKYNKAA